MSAHDRTPLNWTALMPWFSIPVQKKAPARRPVKSAAEREEDRLDRSAIGRARRAAARIGVEIERDPQGGYWVTHPDLADKPEDPCDGAHFCADGREVMETVRVYVDHFAAKP
jgi:hypothetical protein